MKEIMFVLMVFGQGDQNNLVVGRYPEATCHAMAQRINRFVSANSRSPTYTRGLAFCNPEKSAE